MDLTWLSALIVGAALGFCIGTRRSNAVDGDNKNKSNRPLRIEKLADILDDFEMVLVVRNDLKMGKVKIAAQCRFIQKARSLSTKSIGLLGGMCTAKSGCEN